MSHINVTINGRQYRMACEEGQEIRLLKLAENLEQRIPGPPVPGRPHVLKVRPLTSLGVGHCYALRCNGTWGLFKVRLPEAA